VYPTAPARETDGARQRCSFLIQLIRGRRSTRKSDFGIFTQPGSAQRPWCAKHGADRERMDRQHGGDVDDHSAAVQASGAQYQFRCSRTSPHARALLRNSGESAYSMMGAAPSAQGGFHRRRTMGPRATNREKQARQVEAFEEPWILAIIRRTGARAGANLFAFGTDCRRGASRFRQRAAPQSEMRSASLWR
jgi:hypothetical protein